jgi:hypothetical protein
MATVVKTLKQKIDHLEDELKIKELIIKESEKASNK